MTRFASAQRSDAEDIKASHEALARDVLLQEIINAVDDVILVLDSNRQVVFCNRIATEWLSLDDPVSALGLRPGEVAGCEHAVGSELGCGTTEACRHCGAVLAILASQEGRRETRECRLSIRRDGVLQAIDVKVVATPLELHGRRYTIFALSDIGDEKRRKVLERLFFHDLLNTASALLGLVGLMEDGNLGNRELALTRMEQGTRRLIDEIRSQRELVAAESGELEVWPEPMDSLEFLRTVASLQGASDAAYQRTVKVSDEAERCWLTSDAAVLGRVVGNLVRNALEATARGRGVRVGCRADGAGVQFWVQNDEFIEPERQSQIFQRSFSTKGVGRGLGTYGSRLLTENYLGGKVSFTTSPEDGTRFVVWVPREAPPKARRD